MFTYRGSQEPQAQPRPEDALSQQSWYPPSVTSPASSRPLTPSRASSSSSLSSRAQSPSPVSPTEAAGVIASLKDKR